MTTDVVVRPALVAEHEALQALQTKASLANEFDREVLLANLDAISFPIQQITDGRVFVAEKEGVILGFAALEKRNDGQEELDGLFVDPDAWKQGIGRLLIEHCVGFAREAGAEILHVIGNYHAEGFYMACQFRATGTYQTRFGPALLMERAL